MAIKDRSPLAIVSGASSGIGKATSEHLLAAGYSVLGTSRQPDEIKIDHENFIAARLDFEQIDELQESLKRLLTDLEQPPAVLVNNAGVGKRASLEQFSVADIKKIMRVNFLAHVLVTQTVLPLMKQQGQGSIVFIGSEAALQGTRQGSIYCASKFALRGFSQALRAECGGSGVRVSLINPGAVRTEFFDQLDYEPGADASNALEADAVAAAIMTTITAPPETVFDEVNLSPLTRVWQRK